MNPDFRVVYESIDALDVRLEAAALVGSDGTAYQHHRLVVADGRTGAVIVAQRGERVLLARSERPAAGLALWELPRGVGERTDSTAIETALRELREETGLHGQNPQVIGEYIIDTAIFPQRVVAVSCLVADDDVPDATDGELEETSWFALAELSTMIFQGQIQDAHSLAAIALWRAGDKEL